MGFEVWVFGFRDWALGLLLDVGMYLFVSWYVCKYSSSIPDNVEWPSRSFRPLISIPSRTFCKIAYSYFNNIAHCASYVVQLLSFLFPEFLLCSWLVKISIGLVKIARLTILPLFSILQWNLQVQYLRIFLKSQFY